MCKLHEISTQHRELSSLVEQEELTLDDVRDTFEALEGEISAKAVSLVAVVDNINSDVKAVDDEIKRLQARKKTMTNKQDSLRGYLKVNMQSAGITSIKCPLFSITLAKGRDVVVVDDADILPDDLVEVKVTIAPKKTDILKRLKAGEVIEGARIEKSEESLRIK